MVDRLKVTTQGVDLDLTEANGDYDSIERGEMSPDALADLIKKVLSLGEPNYSSGEDLCPPNVLVESAAGDVGFHVNDGVLYETNEEAQVTPFEAVMIATGEKSVSQITSGKGAPVSAPAPQRPVNGPAPSAPAAPVKRNPFVAFTRWIMAFVVALAIFVVGLSGGFGLLKKDGEPIYKLLGVFIIIVTFTIGRGVFKAIRGPKADGGSSAPGRTHADDGMYDNSHFHDGVEVGDDGDDGGGSDGGDAGGDDGGDDGGE